MVATHLWYARSVCFRVRRPCSASSSPLLGGSTQQQRDVIDYLQEENRVLREQFTPRRLRFTDVQRRPPGSESPGRGSPDALRPRNARHA